MDAVKGDGELFKRFYIWMLRKFLSKQSPDGGYQINHQVDESMDNYYVYIRQDEAQITLTHMDKKYVYGYGLFNDHPKQDEKDDKLVPVAIKLSSINWSSIYCHHYYKIGRRLKYSFKQHVVRFCFRTAWFEWQKIKRFDQNITPVSDRYEILALMDKRHGEGSVTYCGNIMEHFYGEQVHKSTKQYEIRRRVKSIVQSLVDDGFAEFEAEYITFSASISPKGIAELERYKEVNRKHAESARTAKSMERATLIMAIAVAIQAFTAILTYAKS